MIHYNLPNGTPQPMTPEEIKVAEFFNGAPPTQGATLDKVALAYDNGVAAYQVLFILKCNCNKPDCKVRKTYALSIPDARALLSSIKACLDSIVPPTIK